MKMLKKLNKKLMNQGIENFIDMMKMKLHLIILPVVLQMKNLMPMIFLVQLPAQSPNVEEQEKSLSPKSKSSHSDKNDER